MKPSFFKTISTPLLRSLCTLSLLLPQSAGAAPDEKPVQVLTRTVQSGMSLQGVLTKNQFRQEAYQENYDVQVPYQETETYYESVPYQEEEQYTDYEQQCSSQYRCHDVPSQECGNEQVCHSVPEQLCHTEHVCRPVPGQERCEDVTECGTNAQGQQICKTRKVCHTDPGSQDCGDIQQCETTNHQECNNEYQCHNSTKQECGNEQVCQSVPVTKTRTVTKYRQEQRTREVTKYRTESRCCVTKYRDVFDHQDSLSVLLRFPVGSELLGSEKEQIKISYVGDASHPDVKLEDAGTILGYKVANRVIQGSQATLDLALAPKYSAEQVSEKSISDLKLMIKAQGAAIALTDAVATKPRLISQYSVIVRSKIGNVVVAKTQAVGGASTIVVIPFQQAVPADQDYIIELTVQRSGIVLSDPVSFMKKAEYLFERIDASQLGRSSLSDVALTESGNSVNLSFKDKGADSRYESNYKVVMAGEVDGKIVFAKDFSAEEILKADHSAVIAMPVDALSDTQNYMVTLGVSRQGAVLSAPVKFETQGKYVRILDPAPYSNQDLVGNLDIQGAGAAAVLVLKDSAPAHLAVIKTYAIQLQKAVGFLGTKRETIFQKTLSADQVKVDVGGVAKLKLLDLGMGANQLSQDLADGKKIFVTVSFIRQSSRLNGGKPMQIDKDAKVKIQK